MGQQEKGGMHWNMRLRRVKDSVILWLVRARDMDFLSESFEVKGINSGSLGW